MPRVPLARKSDPARSPVVSRERLLNAFAEVAGEEAKVAYAVYATPGLTTFSSPSASPCRGIIEVDGVPYSVHAQSVYSLAENGTATLIGSIPGAGPVIMARNDNLTPQIAVVSAIGAHVIQGTSVVNLLTTTDLPAPNSCEVLDGYIIFSIPDGRIFITAINDATSIDPLDFATAEGDPDGLLRVIKYRRELYLMGPKTIEIWSNTGASPFPFERLRGAVIQNGVCGTYAAAVVSDGLYWVDGTGIVRRLSGGYVGERVSNHGVEAAISKLEDKSGVVLFGYVEGGHEFVVVRHPEFTWVLDAVNGWWHERATYGYDFWQASAYVRAYGRHLVGSSLSGKIFTLDDAAGDEDGLPIQWQVRLPPFDSFPDGARIYSLDIDIQAGVGSLGAGEPNEEPLLELNVSRDGGRTFSEGRRASLGKVGEYRKRVRFSKLGRMRRPGMQIELKCSAAVTRAILGADVRADEARN